MEISRISENFFSRDSHVVAKELLGKNLVRVFEDGKRAIGKIVEVEVYQGFEDKASHASVKKSNRNKVMYLSGGHYYIYLIYGMYYCLNIVTGKEGFPAAILIRALEPISDERVSLSLLQEKDKKGIANGPGKLCRWLEIDNRLNGSTVENSELFIENVKNSKAQVILSKRVGVDYAGESAFLDWRYYIKNNKFVSKL